MLNLVDFEPNAYKFSAPKSKTIEGDYPKDEEAKIWESIQDNLEEGIISFFYSLILAPKHKPFQIYSYLYT